MALSTWWNTHFNLNVKRTRIHPLLMLTPPTTCYTTSSNCSCLCASTIQTAHDPHRRMGSLASSVWVEATDPSDFHPNRRHWAQARASMFDAGGSSGEIRWRFRRRSNSRDSMWACSVNGTHAICVRVPHSSTRPRRLELSIGRRRWSPRESPTSTPPLHPIGRPRLMRIQDPGHRCRGRL